MTFRPLLLALILIIHTAAAQQLYFPPLTGAQWDTLSPASLGWNTAAIPELYSFLESSNSKAFIVLKDGRIVLEKYFGTFTRDSNWYWASAGKSMTSFLIGIAQREGSLSINDTSSRWLGTGWTSLPLDKERKITVRHQLTMTSGLDDGVADDDCTLPGCLVYKADAGTRWAYHNAPYTLLDSVIHYAAGTTLNLFFINRVRSKTGMNGGYLRNGYNNVLYSTPRSMARFGLLMLNKGYWGTTAILDDTAYINAMTRSSQSLNPSYGYLWWLNGKNSYMVPGLQTVIPGPLAPAAPSGMYAAMGKNGQFINIVPEMGLVMVRMGDAPDNSLVPFLLNNDIWVRLNAVISGPSGADRPAAVPSFTLSQNFPNPFNPSTSMQVTLPQEAPAELRIFNALGQEAALLHSGVLAAGTHTFRWDASSFAGGVYLCRLQSEGVVRTIKLVVVK
ncbi:MAG: serine hydrolase [Bacteroidetes bacterium]|nr:serine hydrolase [Bacteroidota bacterium]